MKEELARGNGEEKRLVSSVRRHSQIFGDSWLPIHPTIDTSTFATRDRAESARAKAEAC